MRLHKLKTLANVVLVLSSYLAHALTITSDPTSIADRTFSYVIVGGGTAGLTVASRLAEVSGIDILVIEAGPDAQNDTAVNDPAQDSVAANTFDWFYNTTAQLVGGQVHNLKQGKVLGGSSSINGMDWNRGTIDQYNAFEALGNPGWNFASLLQYMKKAERYHLPNADQVSLGATVNPAVHGFSGQVNAGYPQPYLRTAAIDKFIPSIEAAIPGLKRNPDLCSGIPNGVATWSFSINPDNSSEPGGNLRSSSARSYIYPFLDSSAKSNLIILTGHQAANIIWSKEPGLLARATGINVIATPGGSTLPGMFSVGVGKEVIVTSGAIGSPHFLELSGIGDKTILEQAGIPVKVNLPSVGTNLQDQALALFEYAISPIVNASLFTLINEPIGQGVAYLDVEQILGSKGASAAIASLTSTIESRAERIVGAGGFTSQKGLEKILEVQLHSISALEAPVIELIFAASQGPVAGTGLAGFGLWSLLPQWRGTTHVQSSNPAIPPIVNPNYLSNQFDLNLLGNTTRLVRKIAATSPLSQILTAEVLPGLSVVAANATDAEWQSYITSTYSPVFHPVGTVPMLPQEDGGAVDSELVVYGTANVRVIDSSIIPIQLSTHPSGTVYGIAEKGADLIKSDMQL